jgi:predicted RNA-binding protein with EMAP domain
VNRTLSVISVFLVVAGLALSGCSKEPSSESSLSASSTTQEAIEASKTMATTQDKVNYLVNQAKTFYNSEQFRKAIDTAQYILAQLDQNSQEAKSLIDKAKEQLTAQTQKAVDTATEDIKNKIGSFGQ